MRKFLVYTFACSCFYVASAQISSDDYVPLKAVGTIPRDFLGLVSDKVKTDINTEITADDKKHDKQLKAEFLLKSNYMVNELLTSGRVLFGDPVTNYVNQIADKLLVNEPELRKKLRFYTVKSTVTNAFTTNQGMIFVTLGLIGQLENEAQLAMVLGHEIIHFKNKHAINSIIESDKIFASRDRSKYSSYDDNIVRLSNYSKNLEFESDSSGYYYALNAGYDMKKAFGIFDVLQFSHLPYEEKKFDLAFLETDYLKMPKGLLLDTINEIDFDGAYDDSKSTHPNVDKRRDAMQRVMKNNKNEGQGNLLGEEKFLEIRDVCRFESLRIFIRSRNYIKGIYNAKNLLAKYPDNLFLRQQIAKGLYGIYKYKSIDQYFRILSSYTKKEGELSAAYYFFENIETKALGSIAIRYTWDLLQEKPNLALQRMLEDLIADQKRIFDIDYEYYHRAAPIDFDEAQADTLVKSKYTEEELAAMTKYERLRAQKEMQEKAVEIKNIEMGKDEFYKSAFVNVSRERGLAAIYEKRQAIADSLGKSNDEEKNRLRSMTYRQESKYLKLKAENRARLGADKVLYVDPEYLLVDERKGVKLENSEIKKLEYLNKISKASEYSGLKTEIISPKLMTIDEVDKYNDMCIFNEFVGERLDHTKTNENWNFVPYESDELARLSLKYDVKTISYSGVFSFREKKESVGYVIVLGLIPYLTPFCVYYLLTPQRETTNYSLLLNLNSSDMAVKSVAVKKGTYSDGRTLQQLYDLQCKLKSEKKESKK